MLDNLFAYQQVDLILQLESDFKTRKLLEKKKTDIQLNIRPFLGTIIGSFEASDTFFDAVIGQDNEVEFYKYVFNYI